MELSIDEFFSTVLTIGGEKAPKELAAARLEICDNCPFSKTYALVPGGDEKYRCSKCHCPLDKKPFVLSNRPKLNIFKGLKRTKCPHPDGNQWDGVDINILGILKVKELNKL